MRNGWRAFVPCRRYTSDRFRAGETKTAHQANEYIEVEAMIESAKIIALFVMDWCGLHTDGEDADAQVNKE